jgi:drug/metabolite transporter (DMT)-like permease
MWVLSVDEAQAGGSGAALSPITATLLGTVFLAERLSTMALVGMIGVALGLWLAHR